MESIELHFQDITIANAETGKCGGVFATPKDGSGHCVLVVGNVRFYNTYKGVQGSYSGYCRQQLKINLPRQPRRDKNGKVIPHLDERGQLGIPIGYNSSRVANAINFMIQKCGGIDDLPF